MWDWEPQEEPEEEWHSKISHEDQSEFIFPEPEPDPVPEPEPEPLVLSEPVPPSETDHLADHRAPVDPAPSLVAEWLPRIQKFLAVQTNFYITIGVGLGILCGIIVAAVSWHITNPTGPYDLGSVTSTAVGLKGRLFTKWDKKLQYRLTFEPGIPEQIAGFSAAIESSPRPLSIGIQLTDPQGFVLCSKNILIKYDSRNAESQEDQTKAATDQQAGSNQAALSDAEAGVREQGKDVFVNQFGSDGKVASITAQGDLPCTASAYENAVAWSFAPDFPSVAEQNVLINHLAEKEANAAANSPLAIARKRAAQKAATLPTPKFFIEGEDAIEEYDASTGIIATRGGKTFTIDRTGTEAASLKGRDFPLAIHYRCDQFGNCTLTSAGAGVQHTRLRK
jgi:hypothetical protein